MSFLWIFFSPIFPPTLCISSDVNIRCFLESIKSPEFYSFTFSVCFFSVFQMGYILLPFMIINSFFCLILLLSPSNVFVNFQLYFSLLKYPMGFFFIFPNSLLFFTCFQCVCNCFLKHFHNTCSAVFIKELSSPSSWHCCLLTLSCSSKLWLPWSSVRVLCMELQILFYLLFGLASCDSPPSGDWGRKGRAYCQWGWRSRSPPWPPWPRGFGVGWEEGRRFWLLTRPQLMPGQGYFLSFFLFFT